MSDASRALAMLGSILFVLLACAEQRSVPSASRLPVPLKRAEHRVAGELIAATESSGQLENSSAPQAHTGTEIATETIAAGSAECPQAPDGMACVPGGEMTRGVPTDSHRCLQGGQPPSGASASVPASTIWIDTFFIDRTEVTNAAYNACIAKKVCPKSRPFYRDFRDPKQPATGMAWSGAAAYCRFVGKRLPTEAEWEKAARGPEGATNPFDEAELSCANAVLEDRRGRSCGVKASGRDPERGRVLAVGSRSAGRYGLFDMAGNAEEWVADWWSRSYQACGGACAGPNPKGPCGGAAICPGHSYKVVRGGSWYWPAEHASGYHRRRHFPANKPPAMHHFGFRCAASP